MGTITISAAGFTAPRPNGSRAGTMSDADYDRFITWARARTAAPGQTDTRTAGQVLNDFVAAEWRSWEDAITVNERTPPTAPAPVVITG